MELLGYFFSVHSLLIISILILAGLVQLFFILFVALRMGLIARKHAINQDDSNLVMGPSISVVVCGRNIAEDLEILIPFLFQQNYPTFEVVVVDNCSEDDTEDVLMMMRARYPKLRTTSIKNDAYFLDPLQFARFVGVKAAQYDWVVFLDSRSRPVSVGWLKSLASRIGAESDMVLGYYTFAPQKGLFNSLGRFDNFCSFVHFMGFAASLTPYMGDLRNMVVRRSLFQDHAAPRKYTNILSGNRPLFMTDLSVRSNTLVNLHPDSVVVGPPPSSFREWFQDRVAEFALFRYRKYSARVMLFLESLSRVLFWFSFGWLMFQPDLCLYALGFALIRIVAFYAVYGWLVRLFAEKKIWGWLFLMDIFMPLFYLYIWMLAQFKSRRIKI